MTDKHLDADTQRILDRFRRFDEALAEARAIVAATPEHGVVRANVAKTLVEAIDSLLPKGSQ